MAARASLLALCALLALCLVPHEVVSRTNLGAAAVPPEAAASSSVSSSSVNGHGYPCGNVVAIRVPHDAPCDQDRCGALCVELFMWKYPDIKGVIGDCTADNKHQCNCSFLC